MSFETGFYHYDWFNRQTYDNLDSVLEAIEEEELIKENIEKELIGLSLMTEPKKMLNIDDMTDPINLITDKVNSLMEEYRGTVVQLYRLNTLKNNWDECHTKIKDPSGKEVEVAIHPPEGLKTYMCGDFVRTTKYPGWEIDEETKEQ